MNSACVSRNAAHALPESDVALAGALTHDLYARGRVSVVFLLPVLLLLREILAGAYAADRSVRVSFLATLVFASVRGLVSWFFERAAPNVSLPGRWLAMVVPTALLGISLGVLTITAYPHLSPLGIAFLAVCVTGLNSVASISMAPSRLAYFAYMLPSLGALAAAAFLRPQPEIGPWFAPLILLYIAGLSGMALQANSSLRKVIQLQLELRGLAERDGLTRLRNRRYIAAYMDRRTGGFAAGPERGVRAHDHRTLGVIVADLDFFKRINDRHGHEAGDAVLRQFAGTLEHAFRATDVVARWGGEEFVVLVPDADRATLTRMVERLRRSVHARTVLLPSGQTVRVTCSIGYTAFPLPLGGPGVLRWEDVVVIADHALGHAKTTGRDRAVGVFPEDGVSLTASQAAKVLRTAGFDESWSSGLLEMVLTEDVRLSGPVGLVAPLEGSGQR